MYFAFPNYSIQCTSLVIHLALQLHETRIMQCNGKCCRTSYDRNSFVSTRTESSLLRTRGFDWSVIIAVTPASYRICRQREFQPRTQYNFMTFGKKRVTRWNRENDRFKYKNKVSHKLDGVSRFLYF